jgi:ribosome-associated heat shock protein Hsp15
MRIDKYLWCIRVYKTRSIATEEVKNGKVICDEVAVKPSREVKIGDELTIKRHGFIQSYTVLGIPKSRVGAKLLPDLVLETTPAAEFEKRDFLQLARSANRERGLGRPTKKDRRDLDRLDF